jgi:hypothetical protein
MRRVLQRYTEKERGERKREKRPDTQMNREKE